MLFVGIDYILFDHHRYKYKTACDLLAYTGILGHDVKTKYFHLKKNGWITIYAGYAWDGCSGVPDLASTMMASLLHDIGYQCLREELILKPEYMYYGYGCLLDEIKYYEDFKKLRKIIDKLFARTMKEDGAWWITRETYYQGVRILGEKYALPESLSSAA